MSETYPRPTSERRTRARVVEGAPDALQLASLDSIVGYDTVLRQDYEEHESAIDFETYRSQKIVELLASRGVYDSEEDEAQHRDFVIGLELYGTASAASWTDWLTYEEGSDKKRRNVAFEKLLDTYHVPYTPTGSREEETQEPNDSMSEGETTDSSTEADNGTNEQVAEKNRHASSVGDTLHDEEAPEAGASSEQETDSNAERLETLQSNLEAARLKWAEASSKRSGRIFGRKNKDHERLEAEYHAAVQALGAEKLRTELTDDTVTDEQKNAVVVSYIFSEQEVLRNQITENINGTQVGKFVAWMNTGTKWQRAGKGVAVGFGAGVVGSVLAGAAGAGVVAAGTAAAAKFARGYARHDKRGIAKAEEQFDETAVTEAITEERAALAADERNNRFEDAHRHFSYLHEDQTIDQQKKRRKAVAWGAGSVAVGSTLGYGTFLLASQISDKIMGGPDFQLFHPFGERDYMNGALPDTDFDTPDVDVDTDNDGVENGVDFDPNNPDITVDPGTEIADTLSWADFSRDARFVEPNEGGFQTLKEMGIPENKWERIWEDAGAKLNAEGKTYMMDDGHWGWSNDMRLSDRDLTILARAAERNGVNL